MPNTQLPETDHPQYGVTEPKIPLWLKLTYVGLAAWGIIYLILYWKL
ncbi:MAG: hypothetical protein HYY96_02810 [Candidatus Tectomicrobia bacterium]|nr:hypothetical protein [Candidatus Tectomicrobia bacterium]